MPLRNPDNNVAASSIIANVVAAFDSSDMARSTGKFTPFTQLLGFTFDQWCGVFAWRRHDPKQFINTEPHGLRYLANLRRHWQTEMQSFDDIANMPRHELCDVILVAEHWIAFPK